MSLTPEQQRLQRVVCAANRLDGVIALGPRHFDAVMHRHIGVICGAEMMPEAERARWARAEQGFIDQFGSFLTRREAWAIAATQGQIIRWVGNQEPGNVEADEELYSENLY